MPPALIAIPDSLLVDVYRHARDAFPRECCGWLTRPRGEAAVTGQYRCRNAQDDGGYVVTADRSAERAYVIPDDDLLVFAPAFDGEAPPAILYHSHPNGRAYFSATDAAVATAPWGGAMYPVQQLVVGIDGERVVEAKLFDWDADADAWVEISRFDGRDV